jgi:hypothetical protein
VGARPARRSPLRHDVVKYESDVSAIPSLLLQRLRRDPEVALEFQDLTFDAWSGPLPDEHLDIDWDAIASVEYDTAHVRRLMELILGMEFPAVPESTYVMFSPGFSHPDRRLYDEFFERVSRKLGATVGQLPPAPMAPEETVAIRLHRALEPLERRLVRGLHAVGIY